MATSRGRRVLSWVGIALACALLFVIPSSYAVARGAPVWLAAVIGALAFPLVPGAWHLVRERQRKRRLAAVAAAAKTPVKPSAAGLSGRERLGLRMAAVALVAVAPLVVFDRGGMWTGLRHHALWFIPAGDPGFDPGYGGPLLRHVPADAELVIVARDHPRRLIERGYREHGSIVAAMRDGKTMTVLPKSAAFRAFLDGMSDQVKRWQPDLTAKPIERGDVVIFAADSWGQTGSGPGPVLLDELGKTRDDALLAVAFAPTVSKDKDRIRTGHGWVRLTATGVELGAELAMVDVAAAETLVTEVKATLVKLGSAPICTAPLAAVAAAATIEHVGATVTAHLALPDATVTALGDCAGIPK